jgi:hypothetical protein
MAGLQTIKSVISIQEPINFLAVDPMYRPGIVMSLATLAKAMSSTLSVILARFVTVDRILNTQLSPIVDLSVIMTPGRSTQLRPIVL